MLEIMDELQATKTEKKESFWGDWNEWLKLGLIAVFIVIPFRIYIAQPFIVDGPSMSPTFMTSQYLIVDEVSYRFTTPERGSVLIFKYPKDPSKYFIKRIIGLPGETVNIKNGQVSIINKDYPKGFTLKEFYVKFEKVDNYSYTLSNNEYWVMGDNRAESADSRMWGPVPRENFIGRPVIRLWPFNIWPGRETEADKATTTNVQTN
ncbi:MAG: signal peptidase I [Minisyncoccia bacterium]